MADNDFETVLNKQGLADQWPFLRRVIHFNLQYVKKGRREFIHIAPPESVIADKVFQFEGARGMALRDVLRFQGRKARKVTLKGDDVFKVVKEWQLSGQDDKTIYKLATKYGPMGSHVWRFQVRETERFGQFLGDGGRERLAETPTCWTWSKMDISGCRIVTLCGCRKRSVRACH